jgi:class 3 adenylate cyclase
MHTAEIVGFNELASSLSSADLMILLNELFTSFDELVNKHQVYKVDSMGDAYMVASVCMYVCMYVCIYVCT